MGVEITDINGYYEKYSKNNNNDKEKQVFHLAKKVINPLIENGLPKDISHILVATTCPDQLSPSLGQTIKEEYIDYFSNCLSLDIVQGCAGGVTSMILGSQLSESHKSSVLIVNVDAANKATSKKSSMHKIFGDGSFSCLIKYVTKESNLIHHKSVQYKGLYNVVTVNLGHDSDRTIMKFPNDMRRDPRKHLGLSLNKLLAMKLYKKAEDFYKGFISESETPDILILHQVNPIIMNHLEDAFKKYDLRFVNIADKMGNCGAASVGIALNEIKDEIINQKVMLCSFGTGGVITAGLWQFKIQ